MESAKEMLRDIDCAELIDVGRATWWSWNSQHLVPAPIRIGRSVRWRADEIRRWIGAGCPARDAWERIREERAAR